MYKENFFAFTFGSQIIAMKNYAAVWFMIFLFACKAHRDNTKNINNNMETANADTALQKGYSPVNGLSMYYEVYGEGPPLVLIHGGGSTIQTTFGRLIPLLAKRRQLICMELQAHGRTADRGKPLSFEQDANDVVQLLHNLRIDKADFLGFSNGGQTLIEIALKHPQVINKAIISSSFYSRNAVVPEFWKGFEHAQLHHMPQQLQDGFLAVNNNAAALQTSFNRDVERMKNFKGWTEEQIKSIKVPVLLMSANKDICSVEYAVAMHRLFSDAQLIILPGTHGEFLGTSESIADKGWKYAYTADIIESFLD